MSTRNLCFEQKYKKYQSFYLKIFSFLEVKFSIYLYRRVFVMRWSFHPRSLDIFLISPQKHIYCEYSFEAPHWILSNGYPTPMFLWRNKKISSWNFLLSGAMEKKNDLKFWTFSSIRLSQLWIRVGIWKLSSLFLHKNIYFGYSLEVPHQGYDYHNIYFRGEIIKISVLSSWKKRRNWSCHA